MWIENVKWKCQLKMSIKNVNWQCRLQMSIANVNCKCQLKMTIETSEISIENRGSFDNHAFNLSSFFKRRARRQTCSTNRSPGATSRCQNILPGRINFRRRDFGDIEVGRMFGVGRVAIVPRRNDWVEELAKEFVRFFVARHRTNGFDHRVPRVIIRRIFNFCIQLDLYNFKTTILNQRAP